MKRDSEAQFCGFHVCFFFRYFYSNLFFFMIVQQKFLIPTEFSVVMQS